MKDKKIKPDEKIDIEFKRYEEFLKDPYGKLDIAKQLMEELLGHSKDLRRFASQATRTVRQYRALLSFLDSALDDKILDENPESLPIVAFHLMDTMNTFILWLYVLTKELKEYNFEEVESRSMVSVLNSMSEVLLTTSLTGVNAVKCYVPSLINLEKWSGTGGLLEEWSERYKYVEHLSKRKIIRKKKSQNKDTECTKDKSESPSKDRNTLLNDGVQSGKVGSKSTVDDRNRLQNGGAQHGEEASESTLNDRNTLQNDSAQCGEEAVKSALDDQNTLENDGTECKEKPNEKPDVSTVEPLTITSKSGINEGGKSECVTSQVACERREIKKTFKVISDQDMSEQVAAKLKDMCQNISIKCSESPCSSTSDQPKRLSKNGTNKQERETPQTASVITTSKGPYRYKRKCTLDTDESYINKDDMDESDNSMPLNFVPMPKRRNLGRNHYSDTHKTNVNGIGKTKINTHRNFMSKRSCRSNKHNSLSVHENDLSENNSRKSLKKSEANLSETEGKDVILHVTSKKEGASKRKIQNRRGRKKKNVMDQPEINENFKSADQDKNILPSKSAPPTVKSARVLVTNVLDDPKMQRYSDVKKMNEIKKKESIESIARCKEKNEMDETANEDIDKNEKKLLKTTTHIDDIEDSCLFVVDDTSDSENKEHSNNEDCEGLSNNDNREFDSDQEHNADREQHENDENDIDLVDGKEVDESYAEFNDNSSNSFDSETKEHKKGPSTPDVPPPESDLDHSDDENDANSLKSEDGAGSTISFTSDDHQSYGKKGLSPPRKPQGPHTPPGSGPDTEVTDDEESNSSE